MAATAKPGLDAGNSRIKSSENYMSNYKKPTNVSSKKAKGVAAVPVVISILVPIATSWPKKQKREIKTTESFIGLQFFQKPHTWQTHRETCAS